MASIYIRNNTIWIDLYQNGKRIRKSTKLKDTKENRKRVENDLLPKLERMDLSPKGTIGFYYKQLMSSKRDIKSSTVERYASIFENHIAPLQNLTIDSFKKQDIKEWLSKMDLSAKSLRLNLNLLSQIFDEAIDSDVIDKNPCKGIKLPRIQTYEPQPFSKDEMNLLLENADSWFKNFLALLFMTGMRIGEAIALEWKDVNEYIYIYQSIRKGVLSPTKTYNKRYVPVFAELKPYLQDQKLRTGLKNTKVFVGLHDASDLQTPWFQLLRKCNMEHRVLYQARHSFAIHALDSGKFRVSQISRILGHNSVQMLFQKYAKFIKSEVENMPKDFNILDTKLVTKAV